MKTTTKEPVTEPTEPVMTNDQALQNWIDELVCDFVPAHIGKLNVFEDRWRIDLYVNKNSPTDFGRSLEVEKSFFLRVTDGEVTDLTIAPSLIQRFN